MVKYGFLNFAMCFLILQLFTSVVVYGLFHGMVFLPVVLSLVKPTEKIALSEKYTPSPIKTPPPTMNGVHISAKSESGKGYTHRTLSTAGISTQQLVSSCTGHDGGALFE